MKKLFFVIIIIAVVGYVAKSAGLVKDKPAENNPSVSAEQSEKAFNLQLNAPSIKKVDGKHRYFFAIRNNDDRVFNGKIIVTLHNKMKGIKNAEESYQVQINSGGGKNAYIDTNTGPEAIHADACVDRIEAKAITDGGSVTTLIMPVPRNVIQ